jgi:pyrimidine/purine-5'-nucleotide nucleosidase
MTKNTAENSVTNNKTIKDSPTKMNTSLTPKHALDVLSHYEVQKLQETGHGSLYDIFRKCALAILKTGSGGDDAKSIMAAYPDFEIKILQQDRGLRLQLINAPSDAFVDGEMIASTREMLFSALRDIVYCQSFTAVNPLDENDSNNITDYVFELLRNAKALRAGQEPNLVVCWGGHSIALPEYDYTKEVGHALGLRKLNICTGCGPGAMKGPMKGATIAHAKQRVEGGRYLGLTEPGIIAAEAPNPIVNELIIMPDIEKRLEAFVRMSHGIIIFPGGAGTSEELLYLLGILLHPKNREIPFPLILTGPKSSADYFQQLHEFINTTLGFEAQQKYKIIIDDADAVAREMKQGIEAVTRFRKDNNDAFHYNWMLKIDLQFQHPFDPTHENMAALKLHKDQPVHELAANLRRAFSGIVAGNVKEQGIAQIEASGPYQISGDKEVMEPLDVLLQAFVKQQRMKLPGSEYIPCYEVVK